MALGELADNLARENNKLRLCQSQLEYRHRRDNLLLYGVHHSFLESWEAMEEKLLNMTSSCFNPAFTKDALERAHRISALYAHRIGALSEVKHRPVVVKFRFFKNKAANSISVSEAQIQRYC